MGFWSVVKSVTLSDLELPSGRHYALFHTMPYNTAAFGANCIIFTEATHSVSNRNIARESSSWLYNYGLRGMWRCLCCSWTSCYCISSVDVHCMTSISNVSFDSNALPGSLPPLYYFAILILCLTPPREGFPRDDLWKIWHGSQSAAKVQNCGEILLRKFQPPE